MPMIDLTVPQGAVDAHALIDDLTRTLLKWECVPDNPVADGISWGYVHKVAPGAHHVGHQANGDGPARYRVLVTVPEGALDDERKADCRRTSPGRSSSARAARSTSPTRAAYGCSSTRSPTATGAPPDGSSASRTSPGWVSGATREAVLKEAEERLAAPTPA